MPKKRNCQIRGRGICIHLHVVCAPVTVVTLHTLYMYMYEMYRLSAVELQHRQLQKDFQTQIHLAEQQAQRMSEVSL